jgi:LytS/YehU family sensor histidine kinase
MLNAIQQVVLQKSPQEAQEHLAKLSHLMQYVLEKSPLERVALSEELEMIERYIQLEQLQQGHRFDYTITVNADEQTPIPALLLYSYVEDAIINGLTPASGENLHLQLHLQRANDLLTVTIVYNNASRKKVKPNNNNSQGGTIGKEILTLLTHLTHKNHLQQIEDQVTGMEDYIVTKVTLRIPIEGRPGIPTVAPEDDVFEIGD